jgi:nucleotide-binding universal stress UspA family protein
MSIRKLLLPLIGTSAGEAALGTALEIAGIWGAHLLALHVRVDSRDVAPLAGEGLSGAMIEDMMTATETEGLARAQTVRTLFESTMAARGIPIGEPSAGTHGTKRGATASFAAITGREEDLVAQQARLADLTVVPHAEASDDVSASEALHAVLFDSGRPVLVAPPVAPGALGRRICLAWNGTAESASAVTAALPWLARAEAVRILTAEEYQRRGPAAADLATYLALHDIAAEIATFRPLDRDVGAGLLQAAGEFGADLLAMGAYSHSRLRQLLLGGVTRHVLEHAKLPVLMNR